MVRVERGRVRVKGKEGREGMEGEGKERGALLAYITDCFVCTVCTNVFRCIPTPSYRQGTF